MKDKIKKFLLPISIVLVIFILAAINLLQNRQTSPSSSLNKGRQPINALAVVTIVPEKTFPLRPGKKQSFIITFNQPIDLNSLHITMTRSDYTQNNQEIAVPLVVIPGVQNSVTAIMQENVIGYNQYTLNVVEQNVPIYKVSYLSDRNFPTALANNHQLVPFLPHETDTFKLTFDSFENLYIFNFTYNPNSPLDLQTQYQNAKSQALDFIKSKNVDPNSLVIDWRYN